jgi:hypothetical protein
LGFAETNGAGAGVGCGGRFAGSAALTGAWAELVLLGAGRRDLSACAEAGTDGTAAVRAALAPAFAAFITGLIAVETASDRDLARSALEGPRPP